MAVYSIGNRTSGVGSGAAGIELRTGANARVRLMEWDLFLAAATASTFGIGRPAAIGVTPTTPVTWVAEDPGEPAGTAQTALAWSTGPTIPAVFFRRIALPATIGTGIIWTFPRGLIIQVSWSLILWNLAANGVSDVNLIGDE